MSPDTDPVVGAARPRAGGGLLGLDPDDLVTCVSCGLCLPHCPTYRVTGLEIASPRGRITAMRTVEEGAPMSDAFLRAIDECIGCRGCEAACPSSVPYGRLLEGTQHAIARHRAATSSRASSRFRRLAEAAAYRLVLPRHGLLVALSWFLWAGQRLRIVPSRLGAPPLSLRSLVTRTGVPRGAREVLPDAWLFTGCVMDAWQRPVHRDAARVIRASGDSGTTCARPGRGGDCCGALHLHAGRHDEAIALARRTIASMPGDAPVVVDSAGCGAAMKEYGRLLSTPQAAAFAARVRDFSEYVAERGLALRPTGREVVVQDPCHLRHVQRAHGAVRSVLAAAYTVLETDDDGLCCGAGGAYAMRQPELAGAVRARKVEAIERVGGAACVVASANPGCALHLEAAGLDVRHPAELLAEALARPRPAASWRRARRWRKPR